jgi:phosphate-selective porin OprO/OprP
MLKANRGWAGRNISAWWRRAAAGGALLSALGGTTSAQDQPSKPGESPPAAPAAPPAPEAPAAPVATPPASSPSSEPSTVTTASPADGFGFKSADGAFVLKVRGVLQADARAFVRAGTSTFLVRRARPTLEGTVYKYFDYRITAELTQTPAALDVYANVRLTKELQLRAGRFKTPVGLERLQNDADLPFAERGLPSDLIADRDLGAMLHGDLLDGTVSYALGFFNGAGDGASGDLDNNDKKEVDARLFVKPLRPLAIEALRDLGLGIAATRGTLTGPQPKYSSTGQQPIFSYADNAWAAGTHRRLVPQAYWCVGPVAVLGEYARSTQIVTNGAASARVEHDAWQVSLSGFLTGEKASYGTVEPRSPLDPARGGFGAVEIAARYGALEIDPSTFDLGFADANKAVRSAKEWAIGVNWHLARGYKLEVNYDRTKFEGGAKGGDRPEEILVLSRLQAIF